MDMWVRVHRNEWVGLQLEVQVHVLMDKNLRFSSIMASICFDIMTNSSWHIVTAFQACSKVCKSKSMLFY